MRDRGEVGGYIGGFGSVRRVCKLFFCLRIEFFLRDFRGE